jgi:hypothetical protein
MSYGQPEHMNVMVDAEFQEHLAVNWVPLSVMMQLGTPKRWMMLVKNSAACSDLMLVTRRASIHLENLSMVTSKWVKPSVVLFRGPTKSSPQMANGHVMGMVCRA